MPRTTATLSRNGKPIHLPFKILNIFTRMNKNTFRSKQTISSLSQKRTIIIPLISDPFLEILHLFHNLFKLRNILIIGIILKPIYNHISISIIISIFFQYFKQSLIVLPHKTPQRHKIVKLSLRMRKHTRIPLITFPPIPKTRPTNRF